MNRKLKLTFLDVLVSTTALLISFLLRFEFYIPSKFLIILLYWVPWFAFIQIIVFHLYSLYDRIWRYTSLIDLFAIIRSAAISSVVASSGILFSLGSTGYPRSVLILYFVFNTILSCLIRLSVRIYFSHYQNDSFTKHSKKKTLILIGAGKTGEKIAREILSTSRHSYVLAGFVDDDFEKIGALLHGKKVFCSVEKLPDLKLKYDELLITAPSATGDQIRRIVKICKQTGKKYKILPALNELIDGELSISSMRNVSYSDLLGRQEVKLDMNSIENLLIGKRVLITGAGGSIGSELVRQCLSFQPGEIICLDHSEEKIYNIDQEFDTNQKHTIIKTVLCSVNKINQLEKVFFENRPQIVFHAAAYKHVPIQEIHPWTAVSTNIGGTYNLMKLSDQFSVNKFVLVSTDKAVNPVNIMGATKRAAEKLISSFNSVSKTCFMSVRFGNVLGSSGSAIPTFKKQISEGGPITITHPQMTRYFMSIQEASQLIIQCGSFGKVGEIFLLEMGQPIKILNMAKDLVRLSGFDPDVDIPIVFTGLRPGEKLYEELQFNDEKKIMTDHKKIMILKDNKKDIPWKSMEQSVKILLESAENLNSDSIRFLLQQLLPSYKPGALVKNSDDIYKNFSSIKVKA